MSAAVNQDFATYQGDAVTPIFTVKDSAGVVVDISTASDIQWNARRNMAGAAVLSKSKLAGQISFVTNGVDGQFQVTITAANTALLTGYYLHEAIVVDASSNPTTVTVGRMQVGLAPQWTYDPGQVGTSNLYTVRNLIGDVLAGDQKLSDAEITWAISQYSNLYLAAAECCRNIAARATRKVDISVGTMRTNYSQEGRNYNALASELEQRGMMRGGVSAYVGGISVSDKQNVEGDSDRVAPQFVLGEFDNFIGGSVGHETMDNPSTEDNIA